MLGPEIKLTDSESALIIYTSFDLDFFTNMLISQSSFTEWFTTNYEGDNTTEKDLLKEVLEQWESVVSLATLVIAEYEKLRDNHKVIFQQKWWE